MIYAADCLGPDGLDCHEDGDVHHVITDPPYSAHVHSNGRRGNAGYGESRSLGFGCLTPEVRLETAKHIGRLTRRWALLFCDVESIAYWRIDLERSGLEYVRTCFWHKPGMTPQLTGDRPASHVEAIVVAHSMNGQKPAKKRWRGGGRGNLFRHSPVRNLKGKAKSRVHQAQKPLALMKELVSLFTDPGDVVLDPFCGSGTTGVACKQLRRKFVGYEIDRDCAQIAADRLAMTRALATER